MPFFGTVAESVFWKKIQSTETYTNLLNVALWIFFPQNTLGDGPAFWIFFQDSRIRVKAYFFATLLYDRLVLTLPPTDLGRVMYKLGE